MENKHFDTNKQTNTVQCNTVRYGATRYGATPAKKAERHVWNKNTKTIGMQLRMLANF